MTFSTSTPCLARINLILGGVRSGKSQFGENLVRQSQKPIYLATGIACDEEMQTRIAAHKKRRRGSWRSFETTIEMPQALKKLATRDTAILVDCVTFWLNHLLMENCDIDAYITQLMTVLSDVPGMVVLISNEIGLGGVGANPLAREFCDWQGNVNQRLAQQADCVFFVAAGLPMQIKKIPS